MQYEKATSRRIRSEEKAYEGQQALKQLDADGMIMMHAHAVITRGRDGTVKLKEPSDLAPLGLVSGSLLGSLIGVLGGPLGWAAGAVGGGFFGALLDMADAGVGTDFLEDVRNTLRPGKTALVAEVSEEWITPVDVEMEKLGGVVFRTTQEEFDARRNEPSHRRKESRNCPTGAGTSTGERRPQGEAPGQDR